MQRYYPIMISVEHSRCIVVGGGAVGERRTGGLLEAGADVVLVCPEIVSARLREWKEAGAIRHLPKPFSPDDLEGAALVIAATGADELNGWICDEAKRRGIPANSASDGSRGELYRACRSPQRRVAVDRRHLWRRTGLVSPHRERIERAIRARICRADTKAGHPAAARAGGGRRGA
ncbi:NAD(P)-dependent oxidoreductase [Cohnella ginsengisoli]|uniref:precorrin-2 dehydrogenase n=1 Tax=Cohnella ginsengisoli TaxID=425004 RepID=A0A9X4KDX2_9BACL|nr:NAD(P)-dependent oxidoreductase [Cohnella ginsengisoli]MDG0790212.1 NAD(P)-dependent oxidoreductase [Cohnella ginsengisoli]